MSLPFHILLFYSGGHLQLELSDVLLSSHFKPLHLSAWGLLMARGVGLAREQGRPEMLGSSCPQNNSQFMREGTDE